MAKGWTKLTVERQQRLLALLGEGQSREAACAAVGIHSGTFRKWIAQGAEGDERWAEFSASVRHAESNVERDIVTKILTHGDKDWRALQWYLERRFPLVWGDTRGANAKLDHERETMLDALSRALEKRGLTDAAEEILRELAEGSGAEAAAPASPQVARH